MAGREMKDCRDCVERQVGCHSRCDDYKLRTAKLAGERKERLMAGIANSYTADEVYKNVRPRQRSGNSAYRRGKQ